MFGIFTALPTGMAAAIAVLGDNFGPIVGVAISVSLLPPAVNAVILSISSEVKWIRVLTLMWLMFPKFTGCSVGTCRAIQTAWKWWNALHENRPDQLLFRSSIHWISCLWWHQHTFNCCQCHLYSTCGCFNAKGDDFPIAFHGHPCEIFDICFFFFLRLRKLHHVQHEISIDYGNMI